MPMRPATLRTPRRAVVCLAALASIPACGPEPAPASPPPGEPTVEAPASPPPAPCPALEKPLRTLRELAALVALGRSMPVRPRRPDRFVAELDAEAAQALAVKAGDTDLATLAAGTAARLGKIAAAARALAGQRSPDDAEAARVTLLEEMERGEILVQQGASLCHTGEGLAGRLSAAALARVVRGGSGAFRACYEPALRRDPSLRGVVRVRFVVARDGTVSEASDEGRGPPDPLAWSRGEGEEPLRDQGVSACVVAAFKRLTFPKPEGGTFGATIPVELGRRDF
jgi:hypothetical protein